MVYGGFTAHHHTQMEVFHSNLAGVQYQDEILKQRFELFVHAYQGTYQETSSQAIHQGTLSHNHLGSLSHSGLILAYLHLKKKKKKCRWGFGRCGQKSHLQLLLLCSAFSSTWCRRKHPKVLEVLRFAPYFYRK